MTSKLHPCHFPWTPWPSSSCPTSQTGKWRWWKL